MESARFSALIFASRSCRRLCYLRSSVSFHSYSNGCIQIRSATELISDLPGLRFREITDEQGECATMLTVILPSAAIAQGIAQDLGTKVVARAGWHVYNNMEQLMKLRTATAVPCPFSCFPIYAHENREIRYWQGMLPKTDALLERSLNISIGVSDPGLSSGFGVTLHDDPESVERHASRFREVAGKYLH